MRADYSTTTEIADALMQRADVPFRIGHHFASKVTDYGRGNRLKLGDIPYVEAQRIYRELAGQALPLSEAAFREVTSAEYMVFGRKGLGGPQPAEVKRMLKEERGAVKADRDWLRKRQKHLEAALAGLDKAFAALAAA